MEKIIIEVGSTVTKIDKYNGEIIERLDEITIFFKKNYVENKKILDSDLDKLIKAINKVKKDYNDIYLCGTSIFRSISDLEKEELINKIKEETGVLFNIISQDEESELTVLGTTRFVEDKCCVFIGGGGSTEIAIVDKDNISNTNTSIGVMDVMKKFPDLGEDIATTPLEDVMDYIRNNLNLPNDKCDTIILAGGGHEKFARISGINYKDNTLYSDPCALIMMDIETRIKDTKRYYTEISLDEIRSRVDDPEWWYATRAMCAFVLVVCEALDIKYIVPTNIGMAYGIVSK